MLNQVKAFFGNQALASFLGEERRTEVKEASTEDTVSIRSVSLSQHPPPVYNRGEARMSGRDCQDLVSRGIYW